MLGSRQQSLEDCSEVGSLLSCEPEIARVGLATWPYVVLVQKLCVCAVCCACGDDFLGTSVLWYLSSPNKMDYSHLTNVFLKGW